MRTASHFVAAVGPALLAPAEIALAQGTAALSGRVLDPAGDPVAFAMVRVIEAHRVVQTGSDGAFSVTGLPVERVTITVERLGYAAHRSVVALDGAGPREVVITLTPSPLALAATVVTGTVSERSPLDALSATTALTGAQLDRVRQPTLAQTIAGIPGVAVTSLGPNTPRPMIRGLSGDRVLVLEDGLRTGDLANTSADHAVTVDPLGTDRIEVVRGPMSLLYGPNALGGVVDVRRDEIPHDRPEAPRGAVAVHGNSVSRGAGAGAVVVAPVGALSARGEVTARGSGALRTPAGTMRNTESQVLGAALAAAVTRGWGHAGLGYRVYDATYGLPGDFIGAHPGGVDIAMTRHALRGEVDLHPAAGPWHDVTLTAGAVHYQHNEFTASGRVGTRFEQRMAQLDVVARHDRVGGLAEGAVGVRVQARDIVTGGSVRTPSTADVQGAVFAVEEVAAGAWRVQAGVRGDWARYRPRETAVIRIGDARIPTRPRSFQAVSAALGALWAPRAWARVGAAVTRAYRTPDFNELYSDGPHLAAYSYDVGDPSLGAETGVGVEFFARVERPTVRAEVAGYRNAMRGYVYPRNTGVESRVGVPVFQFTGEAARFTGAEGRVEWTPAGALVLEGSASIVVGELTGRRDSLPASNDHPAQLASRWLPLLPPAQARAGVRWDRVRWFAGAGARVAARQGRTGDYELPTPGYAVADLEAGARRTIGGRLHAVTVRLENLLDAEVRDHAARTKVVLPEAGRNLSLLYRVGF